MPPDALRARRACIHRQLSLEEVDAYLSQPITEEERRSVLELVTWFRRRYPTPAERLRYVTQAFRLWSRPS